MTKAQILSEQLKVCVVSARDGAAWAVDALRTKHKSLIVFATLDLNSAAADMGGLQAELEAIVAMKNGRLQEISGQAIRTVNVVSKSCESALDRHLIDTLYALGINFIVADPHIDFGSRIWGNRYIENGQVKRFNRATLEYIDHEASVDTPRRNLMR